MKVQIGPHEIEVQDTGAPRGERNHWSVYLNGIQLYSDFNGRKANQLFHDLEIALRDKHPK